MVEKGVGRLPIIATDGSERVIGIVTRADLLTARAKTVEEEMQRERLLLR
jgi:predicted transcriptional regulator